MLYLRPSLLLLIALSVLFFSCDPDKAEKKQPETTKLTKLTKAKKTIKAKKIAKIPIVASLDAISTTASEDARTKADTSGKSLGWVSQGKKITFSTTARDKDKNPIPNARFKWEWRKRGKEIKSAFGRIWTVIEGQTKASAKLDIDKNERVGAYELRVSATSGSKGQTVNNHKETPYKFTVRKAGCPPPSTSAKYQPANLISFRNLLKTPLTDKEIRAIDTSRMNSFSILFLHQNNFNQDISCWDTSNVIFMTLLFDSNSAFNQDIGDWDTSKVNSMNAMFADASKFNQDISRWDTSAVISMNNMFEGASEFNQDLSGWNVDKVTGKTDFAKSTTAWTDNNHLPDDSWYND